MSSIAAAASRIVDWSVQWIDLWVLFKESGQFSVIWTQIRRISNQSSTKASNKHTRCHTSTGSQFSAFQVAFKGRECQQTEFLHKLSDFRRQTNPFTFGWEVPSASESAFEISAIQNRTHERSTKDQAVRCDWCWDGCEFWTSGFRRQENVSPWQDWSCTLFVELVALMLRGAGITHPATAERKRAAPPGEGMSSTTRIGMYWAIYGLALER